MNGQVIIKHLRFASVCKKVETGECNRFDFTTSNIFKMKKIYHFFRRKKVVVTQQVDNQILHMVLHHHRLTEPHKKLDFKTWTTCKFVYTSTASYIFLVNVIIYLNINFKMKR